MNDAVAPQALPVDSLAKFSPINLLRDHVALLGVECDFRLDAPEVLGGYFRLAASIPLTPSPVTLAVQIESGDVRAAITGVPLGIGAVTDAVLYLPIPRLVAVGKPSLVFAGVRLIGTGGVVESVLLQPKLGTKDGSLPVTGQLLCGLTTDNTKNLRRFIKSPIHSFCFCSVVAAGDSAELTGFSSNMICSIPSSHEDSLVLAPFSSYRVHTPSFLPSL